VAGDRPERLTARQVRFLFDNMVPRGVARVLARQGHRAVPVRRALRQDASDAEIVAFALAQRLLIVTHDVGMARRARDARVQHVFRWGSEPVAEERVAAVIGDIETLLDGTALRVTVFKATVRADSS
jgi:hypothetical protein